MEEKENDIFEMFFLLRNLLLKVVFCILLIIENLPSKTTRASDLRTSTNAIIITKRTFYI